MLPDLQEYTEEIKDLWDSHWITNMAEKHNKLQVLLQDYLGVNHVNLTCNGHLALESALEAFDLPKGSEIITTPFTFASTVHAIVRRGFVPVFCDIKPDDYTMDPSCLEKLITDKTSAIVPVHIYGNVCDIDEIQCIADRHGLKVIYDAAHTFGERYKGRGVVSYGDLSILSFHATKVFHTIEGGAVCHNNDDLVEKLNDLRNFGIRDVEEIVATGGNAKMNEFAAAMGICNLRHIDEVISKRKALYERYIENLKDVKGLKLNYIKKDVESNYAYFPVLCEKRDELFDVLKQNGIYARKYFYPIASEYDCYKEQYDSAETPVALDVSRKVLTLPLYPDLAPEDVDRICQIATCACANAT